MSGDLPSIRRFITVELAAYAAIFVLGLALRIGHLDTYPLDPGEATRALSGWQLIRGEVPVSWQEPLVVLAAAISFLTLGDMDVTARLAPVAVGSATVLLPWLLRMQIGRLGALMASLFLAISPSFVFYSRTLSGDIFAAALALGLLVCIVRYVEERRPEWSLVGAGLLALLLNAGAPGLSSLLVFAVFFALQAATGKSSSPYATAWTSFKADKETVQQAGKVLLGGFILVGSGFLTDLSGLKLPALAAWIAEFNLVPDGRPWYFPLGLLLGYELLITVAGVAAAVYYVYLWHKPGVRQSLGIKGLLIFWAVAGLAIAASTGNKYGGQLLGLALPLALLAGALAGELGERVDRRLSVTGEGPLLAAAPFLVYAFLMVSELTRQDRLALWYQWTLVFLALAMVAAMVAGAVAYGGNRLRGRAALIGLALLLGYSVHTTWRTAFAVADEPVLSATLTSRSLVDAVDEIGEVATARFLGKNISVAVEPGLRLPTQWYLRNHTAVQYTTKPQPGTQAIIWPVEQPPEINLEDYFARQTVLVTNWTSETGKLSGLWRWLMFGEPPNKPRPMPVMLYLHK